MGAGDIQGAEQHRLYCWMAESNSWFHC
jgi:hypothetical protein